MTEEKIVIKQLPIIEEQLIKISEEIDKRLEDVNNLVCTEETRQSIKKIRSDLNKELKDWETKRKEIKEQILVPYNAFEESYKKYISEKYKIADDTLKTKIDSIENKLKDTLKNEAIDYFEEYKTSKNIDFIKFEDMKCVVGVSDNPTKLQKLVRAFIDKIEKELQLIETQEHKAEILVEYKKNLDVSNAITTVSNRYKAIEEEQKRIEQKQEFERKVLGSYGIPKEKMELNNPTATEILNAPQVEDEKILTTTFKVNATKSKLKELKKFLDDGGYDYE